MPRFAVFGFALALIACTQQGGREETVSAAQPRDEAMQAAPASAPQLSGQPVPRASQPRDEAGHVAPPSAAPQLRDEAVPRATQPRDEAVHVPPPSAPQ
jgi:hypothetical protein